MNNKPGSGGRVGTITEKPKNIKQTIFRLTKYMKKSTVLIVLTLLITVCGTVMQVLSPKITGNAITEIYNGILAGNVDFNKLLTILALAAALYAGAFAADFLQQRFMVVVAQKTTYALRNAVRAKMNRVPVSFFDKNANGNLMSVAANDIDNITTNLQQSLVSMVSSVVIALGTIAMMLYISPLLTVIALIMIPGTLLIMKILIPTVQKNNKQYYRSLGNLNGQIEETYQGFQVVKGFNGERNAVRQFAGVNEQMYESGWRARFFGGISVPLQMLVQNLVYIVIAGDGSKVTFEAVQFGYGDIPLMNNFSVRVRAGETIAIVGHTGAGKTTLINLLERFYDIQKGSIRIDGTDIYQMSRKELRGKMAMVLQDTWLFSGTIYENIKYGNEHASEEDIMRAAKAAYVDDFVRKLPLGYQTVLNEEASNLSQGQRQLITIARAFAADPDILILDEATSNVDSRTELVIQKAMKKLLTGRTSFIVAHRLSTIYDADKILVMDRGDIVESGTHSELIAKDGVYADIYNSQFDQNMVS